MSSCVGAMVPALIMPCTLGQVYRDRRRLIEENWSGRNEGEGQGEGATRGTKRDGDGVETHIRRIIFSISFTAITKY